MKRIVAFSISIMIVLIMIFNINWTSLNKDHGPLALAGEMSVSLSDITGKRSIELSGEWEYYPGELITPTVEPNKFDEFQDMKELSLVPGEINVEEKGSIGTYRLIIHTPIDQLYAMRINSIRYANKLFLNGEEVGSSGTVSVDAAEYEAYDRKYTGYTESIDNKIEVVIHIANHRKGSIMGIVRGISFGTTEQISLLQSRSILVDAISR